MTRQAESCCGCRENSLAARFWRFLAHDLARNELSVGKVHSALNQRS